MMSKLVKQVVLFLGFKLGIIAFILLGLTIWPLPPTDLANRPTSLAKAFTFWDGAIYSDICATGYSKEFMPYPENLIKYAFYPGLPILLCFAKAFVTRIGIHVNWFNLLIYVNIILFIFMALSLSSFTTFFYPDKHLRRFVFWTYLLFPFSFFFHVNYSEVLFIGLMFLGLIYFYQKRVWFSHLVGLAIGTVRITSLPLGFLNWLYLTVGFIKDKDFAILKTINFLLQSLGFLTYGLGTVALFVYFSLQFGSARLFFDSQENYFQRKNSLTFYQQVWRTLRGEKQWFDNIDWEPRKALYNFQFYGADFNRYFLLYFPFAIAIIASVYLTYQKRWYELFFAWILWIAPMLSGTSSLNRYILAGFPFIFAVSELAYRFTISRLLLPAVYIAGFLLTLILFTHGFWVG